LIAVYVRQSVDKKDSISIESQIEYCKNKIISGEEYKIYEDKGFSGKNTARPQFLHMMKDIERGEVTKVIIYKLDRISRAILDFANMMDTFDKHNVSIISCNDPIDTTTPMGRAMLTVTMTFAQLERETIQQRIKDNYYARGKQGYYLGGRAPFGYKKIETILNGKKTYTFESQTGQAEQVYQLFSDYGGTDISLGKLSAKLTEEGTKTNSGGIWSGVSLGRLLRNPVYVKADADIYLYLKNKGAIMNNDVGDYIGENGCYVYAERKRISKSKFTDLSQSYVTLALHKGLIPADLWLRCQHKLDNNKQIKNNGKGTHSWLSGLMKCGYCGMAVNVVNNNRGSNYINCGGRKLRICYERKRVVKIEQIEAVIQEQLLKRIKKIKIQEVPTALDSNPELNYLKIKLVQIEEKINNFIKQIGDANNVVMQYINRNVAELDEKRKDINSQIVRLSNVNDTPDYGGLELEKCIDNWDNFDIGERKIIAKTFMKKVGITDDSIEVIFY